MKWIKQPENKNCCGQIAVAVISGISLEDSFKKFGKKGCTRTKEVIKVLRELGYKCADRLSRKLTCGTGIAKLTHPTKQSHWVVYNGDKIYDGIYGTPDGKVNWPLGSKLTSYLSIQKCSHGEIGHHNSLLS